MNDPPNPIHKWMRDARKEFSSADEMKAALVTVRDENARKLLEREAVEWALEELRRAPPPGRALLAQDFVPERTGTRKRPGAR